MARARASRVGIGASSDTFTPKIRRVYTPPPQAASLRSSTIPLGPLRPALAVVLAADLHDLVVEGVVRELERAPDAPEPGDLHDRVEGARQERRTLDAGPMAPRGQRAQPP